VFDSWNSDRAKKYMAINQITGLKGTAVTVQVRTVHCNHIHRTPYPKPYTVPRTPNQTP